MQLRLLCFVLTAPVASTTGLAAQTAAARATPGDAALVARGRHLVNHVALCGDCHTPRLPSGALDERRAMQGALIECKPLIEMPWASVATPLAGLPGRTDASVTTLLTTGRRIDGTAPLPPMPAFRLQPDEARAVIAYLRSLPPAH